MDKLTGEGTDAKDDHMVMCRSGWDMGMVKGGMDEGMDPTAWVTDVGMCINADVGAAAACGGFS